VDKTQSGEHEALTVGIEEEFLLVDRAGQLSSCGPKVVEEAGGSSRGVYRELTSSQVEATTRVCHTGKELLDELRALRTLLAATAARRQLRLVPCGTSVLSEPLPSTITPDPRYARMAERFGAVADATPICGCHVHVGMPDRAIAVQVSNHLRVWLPLLLALSSNSPYSDSRDTGYASWRYVQWSRWPSAGAPPAFTSLSHYESTVEAMLRSRAMLDRAMVYWDVRLSEVQPTVEVRVADVAITAEDGALYGVVVRGLAGVALRAIAEHRAAPELPLELLRAGMWVAARDGLDGAGPCPLTGRLMSLRAQLDLLHEVLYPVLPVADFDFLVAGLATVAEKGNGAQRQRTEYRRHHCLREVVDHLAREALR